MSDDEFRLDETILWKAGAVTLPRAADKFGYAATLVHQTSGMESAAFGGLSGLSGLESAFALVRDKLQDEVLVKTRENLVKAGEALIQVAEMSVAQDSSLAAEFDAERAEIENDPIPANRPAGDSVHSAPSSDDPVPPPDPE